MADFKECFNIIKPSSASTLKAYFIVAPFFILWGGGDRTDPISCTTFFRLKKLF